MSYWHLPFAGTLAFPCNGIHPLCPVCIPNSGIRCQQPLEARRRWKGFQMPIDGPVYSLADSLFALGPSSMGWLYIYTIGRE